MTDAQNYSQGNFSNMKSGAFPDVQSEKIRITTGTQQLKIELLENWKKTYNNAQIFPQAIANLSKELVEFLLSQNVSNYYESLANKCNLNSFQKIMLAQIIWKVSIEKSWDNIENILRENLNLQPAFFSVLYQSVSENIVLKSRELSKKTNTFGSYQATVIEDANKKNIVKISLLVLLQKYPRLGEQFVSSEMLKLKYLPDLVSPTIKNWIIDYRDVLGNGKHNMVERANFLFHSENGKRITSLERKKLMEIFKSLEDGSELEVDIEKQKIVFDLKSELLRQEDELSMSQKDVNRSDSISPAPILSDDFYAQKRSTSLEEKNVSVQRQSVTPVLSEEVSNDYKIKSAPTDQSANLNWKIAEEKVLDDKSLDRLKDFAPRGFEVRKDLEKGIVENKIFEKNIGIGSDEYYSFQKNENNISGQEKTAGFDNLQNISNQNKLIFEAPQKLPNEKVQQAEEVSQKIPDFNVNKQDDEKKTLSNVFSKDKEVSNSQNFDMKIEKNSANINERQDQFDALAHIASSENFQAQQKLNEQEIIKEDDPEKIKNDQLQALKKHNAQMAARNFQQSRIQKRIIPINENYNVDNMGNSLANTVNGDPMIRGNVVDLSK
jgi:hypothetical protein